MDERAALVDLATDAVVSQRLLQRRTAALRDVERVLGPASCACEGLQCEVDEALAIVRAALAE